MARPPPLSSRRSLCLGARRGDHRHGTSQPCQCRGLQRDGKAGRCSVFSRRRTSPTTPHADPRPRSPPLRLFLQSKRGHGFGFVCAHRRQLYLLARAVLAVQLLGQRAAATRHRRRAAAARHPASSIRPVALMRGPSRKPDARALVAAKPALDPSARSHHTSAAAQRGSAPWRQRRGSSLSTARHRRWCRARRHATATADRRRAPSKPRWRNRRFHRNQRQA